MSYLLTSMFGRIAPHQHTPPTLNHHHYLSTPYPKNLNACSHHLQHHSQTICPSAWSFIPIPQQFTTQSKYFLRRLLTPLPTPSLGTRSTLCGYTVSHFLCQVLRTFLPVQYYVALLCIHRLLHPCSANIQASFSCFLPAFQHRSRTQKK